MADDGKIDAKARMHWLGELAAVLREAEQMTGVLAGHHAKGPEALLLHARITAVRRQVESLHCSPPDRLSDEVDPLWTLSPGPDGPRQ